jgi:hypothetical protein
MKGEDMKKRTLVCIAALGAASVLFAQAPQTKAPAAPVKPKVAAPPAPASPQPANVVVVGSVESVGLADTALGTKSEITIKTADKKMVTLLVKATTTLYGSKGKVLNLAGIKKGDKVKARYTTTPENVLEALSLRLLAK